MAKKDKLNKKGGAPVNVPPVGGIPSTGIPTAGMYGGIPSTGIPTTGIPSTGIPSTGMYGGIPMGAPVPPPPPPPAPGKPGKKDKKAKKQKLDKASAAKIDTSKLAPEQVAQLQLEEAIKESTDPSSRLRKLKSPLSVGGCLTTLAVFVVLTVLIVFLVCFMLVDTFNPITIALDMLDKFGISAIFKTIADFFTGLFSGGGEAAASVRIPY